MIDERALRQAAEALAHVHDYGQQSDLQVARVVVATYESAKPKEATLSERETVRLGSRLTVEGVEAVVVPAEPTEAMAFSTGIVTPSEAAKVYRAMLSAAGERA